MENRISNKKVDELLSVSSGSVTIGVDGNAAFALLGPNIQEGEAEFRDIPFPESDVRYRLAAKRAMVVVYQRLKSRCSNYGFLPYSVAEGFD